MWQPGSTHWTVVRLFFTKNVTSLRVFRWFIATARAPVLTTNCSFASSACCRRALQSLRGMCFDQLPMIDYMQYRHQPTACPVQPPLELRPRILAVLSCAVGRHWCWLSARSCCEALVLRFSSHTTALQHCWAAIVSGVANRRQAGSRVGGCWTVMKNGLPKQTYICNSIWHDFKT